jgi:hypothetical protein
MFYELRPLCAKKDANIAVRSCLPIVTECGIYLIELLSIVTCLWHVPTINVDSPDLTREFI